MSGNYSNLTTTGLNIVSREQCGLTPPRSFTELALPVNYVIFCHTVMEFNTNYEFCSADVRSIQRFHKDEKGWDDIGYNFLIGGDGRVYEGRGWYRVGAHSGPLNKHALGIAFMGVFSTDPPTPPMMTTAQNLIQYGIQQGYISSDYSLHAHSSLATGGKALYDVIQHVPGWKRRPLPEPGSSNSGAPSNTVYPNVGQPINPAHPSAGQPVNLGFQNVGQPFNPGFPNANPIYPNLGFQNIGQPSNLNTGQPALLGYPSVGQPANQIYSNAVQPGNCGYPSVGQPAISVYPNVGQPINPAYPSVNPVYQNPIAGLPAQVVQPMNTVYPNTVQPASVNIELTPVNNHTSPHPDVPTKLVPGHESRAVHNTDQTARSERKKGCCAIM